MAAKGTFLTVKGLDRAEKNFQELINRGTKRATNKAANLVANALKQNVEYFTPVDTGLLRSNWKTNIENDGLIIDIENDTYYAYWVENGHRTVSGGWVEGRFMLRRGLHSIEKIIRGIYSSELQEEMDQVFE